MIDKYVIPCMYITCNMLVTLHPVTYL